MSQNSSVKKEVSVVTTQYKDLQHRATSLLDRLSGVGGRRRDYDEAFDKAKNWMKTVEPKVNAILDEPIAGDPKSVEGQLQEVKALNNEVLTNGRLIDNAKMVS